MGDGKVERTTAFKIIFHLLFKCNTFFKFKFIVIVVVELCSGNR